MKTFLLLIIVVALTAAPAIIHGRFANRWRVPEDLTVAATKLASLPRTIGPWDSQDDENWLSESVCRELGLAGHLNRIYTHRETGEALGLLVMVGEPGPLVRHPPDICYSNRRNEQVGEPREIAIRDGSEKKHTFRVSRFRRLASPTAHGFLVAYAMTSNGRWEAPAHPRIAFGAQSKLYKLQVVAEADDAESELSLRNFLAEFVAAFPFVFEDSESHYASFAMESPSNFERVRAIEIAPFQTPLSQRAAGPSDVGWTSSTPGRER